MHRQTLAAIGLFMFIASAQASSGVMAKVAKVTTGNTLTVLVEGKEMNLRLLGVATPDPNDPTPVLKQLGTQADAFLREFLKAGWVYLEFRNGTPTPDTNGVVDAYVYRAGGDAVFVNERIIREGFGITNRKVACSNREAFIAVEEKAKGAQRGIWSPVIEADGQRVASQGHQMEYLGVASNKAPSVVTHWIFFYFR
jgi:endonuclease YncB( thermonuclease family)